MDYALCGCVVHCLLRFQAFNGLRSQVRRFSGLLFITLPRATVLFLFLQRAREDVRKNTSVDNLGERVRARVRVRLGLEHKDAAAPEIHVKVPYKCTRLGICIFTVCHI